MRALGWVSVILCGVMVAGTLTAYAGYRNLAGKVGLEDVSGKLGDRPEEASGATNILLMGSDTRSAEGTQKYGTASGARSDTVILLHLPPERDEALLVSFPRDSIVRIPSCTSGDGTTHPPQMTRINAAFSTGGPACTWKTIESLTNVRIDHFVMVNFAGFTDVVNALGGIEVCLPSPVDDPKSQLHLDAGPQVVRGQQALAFVRLRDYGNGSDLQRIKRQQEFLAGMIKKATDLGLLLNPSKLYNFLSAAAKSLTTDKGFGLDGLRRVAMSVRGIKPQDVNFVTVPVTGTGDGATVEFKQPEASQLFQAIRQDSRIPAQGKGGQGSQGGQGKPAKPLPPEQVQVQVLNDTTIPGLAGGTADQLQTFGFKIPRTPSNAERQNYTDTVIRYSPDQARAAQALADAVPFATLKPGESPAGTVTLILGENAEGSPLADPTGNTGGSSAPGGASLAPGVDDAINASQNPCKTGPAQS